MFRLHVLDKAFPDWEASTIFYNFFLSSPEDTFFIAFRERGREKRRHARETWIGCPLCVPARDWSCNLGMCLCVLTGNQTRNLSVTRQHSNRRSHTGQSSFFFIYLFIYFLLSPEDIFSLLLERKRERNMDVRNMYRLLPCCAPTRDQTRNWGMCPDQKPNMWPSIYRKMLQVTEPQQTGQGCHTILSTRTTVVNKTEKLLAFMEQNSHRQTISTPINKVISV